MVIGGNPCALTTYLDDGVWEIGHLRHMDSKALIARTGLDFVQ
jgi:hypothetical protein